MVRRQPELAPANWPMLPPNDLRIRTCGYDHVDGDVGALHQHQDVAAALNVPNDRLKICYVADGLAIDPTDDVTRLDAHEIGGTVGVDVHHHCTHRRA